PLSFSFPHQYSIPSRDLLPFPTRRSSDLQPAIPARPIRSSNSAWWKISTSSPITGSVGVYTARTVNVQSPGKMVIFHHALFDERSEEHTSELQSRVDLVCRLLLEKKKQQK